MEEKIAVITGATSGIGLETARIFAENGFRVFSLSRKTGDLKGVIYLKTDITCDDEVIAAFDEIKKHSGHIDILINNAGFGISGAVEFCGMEDAKRQLDLNLFGAFRCIKEAIPMLRKSKGLIINISSAAAVFPIPFQAFYSASKAALNAFTFALINELKAFGIQVCAVMPGDVRTGFTGARQKNEDGTGLYGDVIKKAVSVMENDEKNGMSPEYIAREIYKIASKRAAVRPLYVTGTRYKLFCLLERALPKSLVCFIISKLYG